jgi:hypothetical protein
MHPAYPSCCQCAWLPDLRNNAHLRSSFEAPSGTAARQFKLLPIFTTDEKNNIYVWHYTNFLMTLNIKFVSASALICHLVF